MTNTTVTKQARLFKALMHPIRIKILDILREGEACVCHVEAVLGLRQAYVSQQLAVLRKSGLIADRRDGPNIYYRITQPEILSILDLAQTIVGGDTPAETITALCSCPRCTTISRTRGEARYDQCQNPGTGLSELS
ncbi:MAG: winged helix-turn-helix transcriptional regulator [Chloroflexus sp.]|nr:winged helix-turn-helix transcriptional regulator [Chloroflexus sp.]MBO9315694.1 winged helix-turn-helix transcriptional regulator [Chloroflexus sp.]MBO9338289.1 winged helix-turn-helix transcriptional regulator [Chloroflexus sp.]MBO9349715.1 winged helix-turn-helix transcriptional regulator [Chloroflexus sp.]MBO9373758.1 winged helix-turn-helix transcriptional regulator [Chloroflexus sp.]